MSQSSANPQHAAKQSSSPPRSVANIRIVVADDHPVVRFVHPDEFVELQQEAEEIGFLGVLSGPLVRSSYRAGRLYATAVAARATNS